jgi:hypothetical protein
MSREEVDARPLKGLKRVFVLVEALDNDAAAAGIAPEWVQQTVELRLRRIGLQVVSREEKGTLLLPYIYVKWNFIQPEKGLFAYDLEMSLNEGARLSRNKLFHPGVASWTSSHIGSAGLHTVAASVGRMLNNALDAFENSYLIANPR